MSRSAVVIGGSVAGVRCAQALRARDYPGSITIVESETEEPYDKPELTKSVLIEDAPAKALATVDDLRAQGIEWVPGDPATHLRLRDDVVVTHSGREVLYTDAVIATGSRARQLPSLSSFSNATTIRTLQDVSRLKRAMTGARSLAIVGGGFIGGEVASAARQRGLEVTIVEAESRLMKRTMPAAVSGYIRRQYESHGVTCLFDSLIVGPGQASGDRLESIVLNDGSEVAADVVVVESGRL